MWFFFKKLQFRLYLPSCIFLMLTLKRVCILKGQCVWWWLQNSSRGKGKSGWDFKNLQVKSTKWIIFLMILAFASVTLKSLPVLGGSSFYGFSILFYNFGLFYEWLPSFSAYMQPKQQHNCVHKKENYLSNSFICGYVTDWFSMNCFIIVYVQPQF